MKYFSAKETWGVGSEIWKLEMYAPVLFEECSLALCLVGTCYSCCLASFHCGNHCQRTSNPRTWVWFQLFILQPEWLWWYDYNDMITMTMPMIMTLMMMLICSDVNGNHTCGHFPWSCHPSLSEETPCPRPISLAWCNTWSWWWWCPWCRVTLNIALVFFHDHDWQ